MNSHRFEEALRYHQQNRLGDAETAYREILAEDPDHADASHYLGMICLHKGDNDGARNLLQRALRTKPHDPALLSNFGLFCQETGELSRSVELLGEALRYNPKLVDARYNLGISLEKLGQAERAETCFRQVLQQTPRHLQSMIGLAHLLLVRKQLAEAEALLRRILDAKPEHPLALLDLAILCDLKGDHADALSLALRALDRAERLETRLLISSLYQKSEQSDLALAEAEQAVQRYPHRYEAHRALGHRHKTEGRLDEAISCFGRAHELRRHGSSIAQRADHFRASRAKLRHDLEQLNYLRRTARIGTDLDEYAAALQDVHDAIPDDIDDGAPIHIPAAQRGGIASAYNRCVYHGSAPRLESAAVSTTLDHQRIEQDYQEAAPGIVVVDDFLTADALHSLRTYCLESTIWYDFQHRNGYVGAYLDDGFDCPLLIQIAEELPARLPGIFGDHRLQQLWAYKYDSQLSGIDMHADFAAINVNFWLTPTEASRSPDNGGMIVWNREAPSDWNIDQYNTYDEIAQVRIEKFLTESKAEKVTVAHRQNRVVIFNSDLFHRTDDIDFKSGYENRRINVTMLYGDRRNG